jgi:hypothetical protein
MYISVKIEDYTELQEAIANVLDLIGDRIDRGLVIKTTEVARVRHETEVKAWHDCAQLVRELVIEVKASDTPQEVLPDTTKDTTG